MAFPLRLRGKGIGPFLRGDLCASRAAVELYDCRGVWLPGTPSDRVSGSGSGATAPCIADLTRYARSRLQIVDDARVGTVTQTGNIAGNAWESSSDKFATAPLNALRVTDDGSGFIPTTILTVCRPYENPGSLQCVFAASCTQVGNAGSPKLIIFRNSSGFTAELRMAIFSSVSFTSSGWGLGHLYAVAATSRTRTDHAMAVVNLNTGEFGIATSTTDAGTILSTSFDVVNFGGLRFPIDGFYFRGEINLGAVFGKSLTNSELVELARNPFSLIETSMRGGALTSDTPPVVGAAGRSSIISSGYWAA